MYTEIEIKHIINLSKGERPEKAISKFLRTLDEEKRKATAKDVTDSLVRFKNIIFRGYIAVFVPFSRREEANIEGLTTALDYARAGYPLNFCIGQGCTAISRWWHKETKNMHEELHDV